MSEDAHSRDSPLGVIISQREVYKQVQEIDGKLDGLLTAVQEMAAINKRLDAQHDRQNTHGERIRALEIKTAGLLVVNGLLSAVITGILVTSVTGIL